MLLNKTDFKYTLRLLAKKPGFTLLSVLVLAGGLGISILTATISYTFMFKTLPVVNGERIYHVCYAESSLGCREFKTFEFAHVRRDITTLENIGIYRESFINLDVGDDIVNLRATYTEWSMFSLTQSQAQLGRLLQPGDHEPGAEPVALISHDLWQQTFDGNPEILDSLINVNGVSTRIIGIMPDGYLFPSHARLWLPVSSTLINPVTNDRTNIQTFALLKSGISQETASAEIASLMNRVRQLYPPDPDQNYTHPFFRELDKAATGHIKDFPKAALGGVETVIVIGFINFIAFCIFLLSAINVGTLMLARTNERIKDVSIRYALGAPRRRLLVQTMAESTIIVLAGGLLALLFSGAALELINIFVTSTNDATGGMLLAFWHTFGINRSSLLAVFAFLGLTIVFTSVVPCLRIINGDFNAVMRDGTRGALGLRAGRFSKALVMAAITMITLLIYISSLAYSQIATFRSLIINAVDDNEISTNIQLDPGVYSSRDREAFYREIASTLSQQPAIESVNISSLWSSYAVIEKTNPGNSSQTSVTVSPVMAIFDSRHISIPGANLLEGRAIGIQDTSDGPRTALVSQYLARRFWPGQSPVNETIQVRNPQLNNSELTMRVVGVVSDTVNVNNPLSPNADMIYIPITQVEPARLRIEVVTPGSLAASDSPSLEAARNDLVRYIRNFDPTLVFNVEIAAEIKPIILGMINRAMALGIGCSVFALLVALAGIYGLTQNAVQLMTQEIGTRRALGATDSQIRKLILKRGNRQVLFGFLIAVVITSPLTYLITFFVRNEVLAPVVFPVLFAMALLYAVVYIAMYTPIRKVLNMEPGEALRYE